MEFITISMTHEGNLVEQTEIATGIVTQYEWDYRNRLVAVIALSLLGGNAVGNSDYTYDVNNSRIAKSVDSDGDGTPELEERYVLEW